MPPVVALAGRRVDRADAGTPRFPSENVGLVRERLRWFLQERRAAVLVCSAACGADLLALEAALILGLRRRIVLPSEPECFRETSVIDRPGAWADLYARVIERARRAGDLVVLEGAGEGGRAYAAANERILEEALGLAGIALTPRSGPVGPVPPETALAVIVREGRSRGAGDMTEQFAEAARRRGLTLAEVATV
jgi:hypothetical protein